MSKQSRLREDGRFRYLRDSPHLDRCAVLNHELSRVDSYAGRRRSRFYVLTTDSGVSHHHLLDFALRHHLCQVDAIHLAVDQVRMDRAFDWSFARNGVIKCPVVGESGVRGSQGALGGDAEGRPVHDAPTPWDPHGGER